MARKIWHVIFVLVPLFLTAFRNPSHTYAQSAITIDHTCTKLADIPSEWITAAKQTLHIAYGCSSHGSQLTTGMTGLVTWKGDLYAYNFGGYIGALDLREWEYDDGFGHPDVTTYANDLGDPDRQAWADATREYLNAHPEINVIIWAWCWQMITEYSADIDLYLNLMNELEEDFPGVKFVYMTGHVTARQLWGEGTHWSHMHYMRAKQIRDYCTANNKILYDFADIESWDPDGNWYGDKLVDEACNYDSDGDGETDSNWAVNWQNAHPGEWYMCESPHTEPLNANLKAYSAWWLWARLAGWSGEADITLSSVSLSPASVLGGNQSTGTVILDNPAPTDGTVVMLSSSDPAAQTPTSVTVAAGETTALFVVTTSPVGNDIQVAISGTHNSTIQTATLTVKAAATMQALTVTSPNGGESWAIGSSHAITWTQTGLTGTVTIDLYKGGFHHRPLGTADADAGTFQWTILLSETPGADYRILVWQGSVSDDSDAGFIVRRVKVDFNRDGAEDLLWRYQEVGMYAGTNCIWLMDQNGGFPPLGVAQQEAISADLMGAAAPGQSYGTPLDAGNPQLPEPKGSSLSPIRSEDLPILRQRRAKIGPIGIGRERALRIKRAQEATPPSMPTMKEGEMVSAAPDGTAEIASLMVTQYLYLPGLWDLDWEIGGAGDFNGDGTTDIFWRNYGDGGYSGTDCIWFMNGEEVIGYGYVHGVADLNWRIVGSGDFNGDGMADILWRYYGAGQYSGTNCIWYMNGAEVIGYDYPMGVLDLDWKIVGTGDFNRDGNTDILWRNYGSGGQGGTNCIWYMNGEAVIGYGYPYTVLDQNWRIDGTGDFNKDGYADILWRYYGSGGIQGCICIWYMQGGGMIGVDYPPGVMDTNWTIVNR